MRLLAVLLFVFAGIGSAWCRAPIEPKRAATTDIGALDGVGYRIDIPANWNRGLVVYFHGYAVDPVAYEKGERLSPMFDGMLRRGFAVIQSAYSATGWAVEEGAADTEKLRKHFIAKHGVPSETFVSGMSMGGTLVVMAMETHADVYAGALSLCGAIEPTDRLMQRDFALRAAFDFYFPNLLGPLVPVPADYVADGDVAAKIRDALKSNPAALRALLGVYGAGDAATLPDVLAAITYDIKEMQQRMHGNPFGNADFLYTGSGNDFALNDGVHRYRAEAKAAQAMSRFYTPTGNLSRPMLALHDIGDPLVPASTAFEYAVLAQRAGNADLFVQQYVNANGHCVFTPDEIDRAFGELLDWVHDGKRPVQGRLR
ncbi:MAG: alpha/beta hydrolase [Rhodanobacteraceae bacterium]